MYRKFKAYDIPGSLIKSAPNFCSVYVISKGKILSARTALRPLANTATPPKQLSLAGLPPTPDHTSEENGVRYPTPCNSYYCWLKLIFSSFEGDSLWATVCIYCLLVKHRHARTSWRNGGQERMAMERSNDVLRATSRERARSSPTNISVENIDLPNRGSRTSFSRSSVSDEPHDFAGPMMFGSIDVSGQNLDFSIATHSPKESLARQSAVSEN